MTAPEADALFRALARALARALLLAAALFVALWFLHATLGALVLLFFALVTVIALNGPVVWLTRKGLPRTAAALLVLAAVLGVIALFGWLIVPRLIDEAVGLAEALPDLVSGFSEQVSGLFDDFPEIQERFQLDSDAMARALPSPIDVLGRLWAFSFSVLGGLVILLFFVSLVMYALLRPEPLLRAYQEALPRRHRAPGARAFARASEMVAGWIRSNLIVGAMEAVIAFGVLSFLGVPGALVWAAFTLFAEFIPKLGPYLMAIPPALVAFSVDPMTALWVVAFYAVMNEAMGDLVMPRVRASTMDLHPVVTLAATLLLGAALGLAGALIATPLVAFAHAYYAEFYLAHQPPDDALDARTEAMLDKAPDDV